MSEKGRLHWDSSPGGMMGPKRLLMLGDLYVGHFYEDASSGVDVDSILDHMVAQPMRAPSHSLSRERLGELKSALVAVARELADATASDEREDALNESLGRIAHISASAVMSVRDKLSGARSQMPMFTRCPACNGFHSPGHCAGATESNR